MFFLPLSAQDSVIGGRFYHASNPLADIENIQVFNKTTNKGIISDAEGLFKIKASIGDTLYVTALQYNDIMLFVQATHIQSKTIEIEVKDITTQLDEVLVKKYNLLGIIDYDAKTIETKPLIDTKSVGMPDVKVRYFTPVERRIRAQGGGAIVSIISRFNGQHKRNKKMLEAERAEWIIDKLLERMPVSFFVDVFDIQENQVMGFLYYCELDSEFAITTQKEILELMDYFKVKIIEYKLLLESD